MVWDRRYGPGLIKGELGWSLGSPGAGVRLAPLRLSLQGLQSALQMVDAPTREDLAWY